MLLSGLCEKCVNNRPDSRATKFHVSELSYPWEPGEANKCTAASIPVAFSSQLMVPPGIFDEVNWNVCMECAEFERASIMGYK